MFVFSIALLYVVYQVTYNHGDVFLLTQSVLPVMHHSYYWMTLLGTVFGLILFILGHINRQKKSQDIALLLGFSSLFSGVTYYIGSQLLINTFGWASKWSDLSIELLVLSAIFLWFNGVRAQIHSAKKFFVQRVRHDEDENYI